MPQQYVVTTATAADVDALIADYETFIATEQVIACVMDGQLRLPSPAKVRYYVDDPDGYGHFAIVARDTSGLLASVALCQPQGNDAVHLSYWVLIDSAADFNAIALAGAEHLASLGFGALSGVAGGEMAQRVERVPIVEQLGPDVLGADLLGL